MKRITLLVAAFLAIAPAYAQKLALVSSNAGTTLGTGTYYTVNHKQKVVNGVSYKQFYKTQTLTMQKGAPALPVERASVQISYADAVSLEITYGYYTDYPNTNILPSKGSLMRNVKPEDVAYTFGPEYNQDAFYPGKLAEAGTPYIMRDTRGVTVSVYPYQYNPVTKVLRVYYDINVKVVTNGAGGKNQRNNIAKPANKVFSEIYKNHYINARTLDVGAAPEAAPEMLIVSPDEFVETIAPLADWKNQSGIKTTVAVLSEIGYDPEQIKAYIADYYAQNPGLTYILLVGDHVDVPAFSYGITDANEELHSDSWYAQLEGDDYYPELLVGRFSGSIEEVSTMVNRTLEYETAPLEGDWMTRLLGIGSNEGDGYGDDGEPDWQHVRNINNLLMEYGYTEAFEFFDGSHGGVDGEESPTNTMIADGFNAGVGLANYTGHGATEVFATGGFSNYDVMELANNGMYPFVISVACNNGTFAYNTSICEAWLRAENGSPTGAIAACGSSILMAWAEPMQTQDRVADLIIDSEATHEQRTLGGLFYEGQISTLETYGESDTAIGVMQTWIFFGDPSVTYRNAPNQELSIVHNATIVEGSDSLAVTGTEGATVAVTQNGVIIGTAVIVNGEAVIALTDFDPSQPLTITGTAQNYTPYQGTMDVTMGADGFATTGIKMYPNPAGAQLTIAHTLNGTQAAYNVYDVTGKVVATGNVPAGDSFSINTSGFANGMYLVRLTAENGAFTGKFVKK